MRPIDGLSAQCQILTLSDQVSFGCLQVTDTNDAGSRKDLLHAMMEVDLEVD